MKTIILFYGKEMEEFDITAEIETEDCEKVRGLLTKFKEEKADHVTWGEWKQFLKDNGVNIREIIPTYYLEF